MQVAELLAPSMGAMRLVLGVRGKPAFVVLRVPSSTLEEGLELLIGQIIEAPRCSRLTGHGAILAASPEGIRRPS